MQENAEESWALCFEVLYCNMFEDHIRSRREVYVEKLGPIEFCVVSRIMNGNYLVAKFSWEDCNHLA